MASFPSSSLQTPVSTSNSNSPLPFYTYNQSQSLQQTKASNNQRPTPPQPPSYMPPQPPSSSSVSTSSPSFQSPSFQSPHSAKVNEKSSVNTSIQYNNAIHDDRMNNDGYTEMYRNPDGFLLFDLGKEVFSQYVDLNADMDGDGILEHIVGDTSYDYSDPFQGLLTDVGRVSIEMSSTNQTWEMVGFNYQKIGTLPNKSDVNGDGQADLLVRGSSATTYLFYGPLQIYLDDNGNVRPARAVDADATLPGEVRNIFDNNNDGYDDLIMWETQTAYLYHGAPNSAVELPTSPSE